MCLYGWVVCPGTELKPANRPDSWECTSCLLWGGKVLHPCTSKKCVGQSHPEQEYRVLVCCAFKGKPQKASVQIAVLSEYESTRPLSPQTKTSPWGEFVSALSSRTNAGKALCWWAWDLELGRAPRPFWVPRNNGCSWAVLETPHTPGSQNRGI